jgi:excisionase family DNA binding protein
VVRARGSHHGRPNSLRGSLGVTAATREELIRHFETLIAQTESPTVYAAAHGVSIDTVRRWIERGEVQTIRIGRNLRLWRDA